MLVRLTILALLPVFAAVSFVVAFFVFYRGSYEPPPTADVSYGQINTSFAPSRETVVSSPGQLRQGLLVVDAQHGNSFTERELASFTSRVAERGYDVEFVGDFLAGAFPSAEDVMGNSPPVEDPGLPQQSLLQLAEKLRRADSFAVILPQTPFTEAEAVLVERFVQKGGKLLLVSDPGRLQSINGLAERFGVDFQPDYLYNTVENNGHFRRILIRDFQPDRLTAGLDTITLEYAGSVQSPGGGLAFSSPGTRSSVMESLGSFSPIAWGNTRNVLAVADFTFMVPVNDSLLDNGRLVSNIADYLTESAREFRLGDFPYFYASGPDEGVDILIGQPSLLNVGLQAKNGLAPYRVSSQVVSMEDVSRDTVFLGLYQDAPQVGQYLQAAGVRVDDTLGTTFAPELELQGTAVMVLDQSQDRDMLVVLADTPQTLAGAVASLFSGEFRGDLASDFVAIRKFEGMGQ